MTTNNTEEHDLYLVYRDACAALGAEAREVLPRPDDGVVRALYESVKGTGELYPTGSRGYTLSLQALASSALWDQSPWTRRVSRAKVAAVLQTRPDPGWVNHQEATGDASDAPPMLSFEDFNATRHGGDR